MAKENVNPSQYNPAEDRFDADLNNFIKQLELIRRIKIITESENYTIKKLEDELTQRKNKINELKEEIAKLEQDRKITETLSNVENGKINSKKEYPLPRWIIIIGVIDFGAFSVFCALCAWTLLKAAVCVCACNNHRLIPLLSGGILVLLILAVTAIVVVNQTKQNFTREKECS